MAKILEKIKSALTNSRRIVYYFNGKTYICYVGTGCVRHSVEVLMYDYRPTKFFKEKSIGFGSFWIDDYNSIEDGVKTVLATKLVEITKEQEIQNKWEEFEKSIDKRH